MAITTPSIISPVAGEPLPIDPGAVWWIGFDPFDGTGIAKYIQVQISTGTGGGFIAGIVYDSLLREAGGGYVGKDWIEAWPSLFTTPPASGITLNIRGRRQSDVPETSSFSAEVALTMETTLTIAEARTVR